MAIIDSENGIRLVKHGDAAGTYYYLGDDLGGVLAGGWSDEAAAREAFESAVAGAGVGEMGGDLEVDEQGYRLVECAYCNCWVRPGDSVPEADDEGGWEEASEGHAAGCEWVESRAHRRDLA